MADQLHRNLVARHAKTRRDEGHQAPQGNSIPRVGGTGSPASPAMKLGVSTNRRREKVSIKKDEETAEQYRHRLRKARREDKEAEPSGPVRSFTNSTGSGTTTAYPPVRVDPDKVRDNGQFAFNGESWWMVERVFAARDQPNRSKDNTEKETAGRQVLVKWVGWPKLSWEPLSNLKGKEALAEFTERHGDPEYNDGPADVYQRWFIY